MLDVTRREFLRAGVGAAGAAAGLAPGLMGAAEIPEGERPPRDASAEVLNPRCRVPLSFFIDDSTCLVNMGHFCMPQFAEAWPDREIYRRPWKTWPREIPDAFVREFGEWCAEHGVKGKFSIVPFPCCVGWLDRELPGWSRKELRDSLKLVRELMAPRWDIHPEMITHTRVIDLATGRPLPEISSATMENSYPQTKVSADHLAAYLAYALRILKNCDLPCEGITTPGGFGNGVNSELSVAVGQAARDVYAAEIPHYFKYVSEGGESPEPKLEHVAGGVVSSGGGGAPRLTVNVPAGTGDWLGGWDGDEKPQGERYASADGSAGRIPELIERGGPAIFLCHWPGMYTHGTKDGFAHFKRAILGVEGRYKDRTIWMKCAEIARYWAAKGLTRIEGGAGGLNLDAPFACPDFTLRVKTRRAEPPAVSRDGVPAPLREVNVRKDLAAGCWLREGESVVVCLDLAKGRTSIVA
jgi:hypothetical protein